MPSVSYKKIILAIITEFTALSLIYLATLYFRFNQFGQETFTYCFEAGFNTEELQFCTYQIIAYYLTKPTWLAMQFTYLVIPATGIAYLFHRKDTSNQLAQSAIVGFATAILIVLALDHPILAALAALFGIPLGGLIAQSRPKRRTV